MKDTPNNFIKRKDSGRYLKRYLPLSVIFRPALRHDNHLASFRFHLTADTLAFGYILPTTGGFQTCTGLKHTPPGALA